MTATSDIRQATHRLVVAWTPVILCLVVLSYDLVPYGLFIFILFGTIPSVAIYGGVRLVYTLRQRQWSATAITLLMLAPIYFLGSLVDLGIYFSDLGYFRSKRETFTERVDARSRILPVGAPRVLVLESNDYGSALTGPINRAIVFDESGRVAGPTNEDAVAFRRRFFATDDAADYCVKFQRVRALEAGFYVVRGVCEFPQ